MARSTIVSPRYLPSRGVIGARVYRAVTKAIATSTLTAIDFDTASYNPSMMWTASAATRLTAQVGGWYITTGAAWWAGSALGTLRAAVIRLNGTTNIATTNVVSALTPAFPVTTLYQLAAGDYIELTVFQDSGGNLDLTTTGVAAPSLALHFLGY